MILGIVDPDSPGALEQAIQAFEEDGIVVLRGAVDRDYLLALKARMDDDTERLLDYCEQNGGNPRDLGHLQQGPPTFPPFLHRDVLAQPLVWEMAARLLGPRAGLFFYSGNTNCPGSGCQNVHLDQPHAHDRVKPRSTLVLSISPQPVSAANGSVEIWPGTHEMLSPARVPAELLDARRRDRPPFQISAELGDLVVRDARMWHRGVNNPSSEFRHMVSVVIHADPATQVPFDHSARDFVDSVEYDLNPTYVDHREEYLFGPTRYLIEMREGTAESSNDAGTTRPLADI